MDSQFPVVGMCDRGSGSLLLKRSGMRLGNHAFCHTTPPVPDK